MGGECRFFLQVARMILDARVILDTRGFTDWIQMLKMWNGIKNV